MDFYTVVEKSTKNGIDVYPDFKVLRSKDLMIRGKGFYSVWDDARGLWSTDEYDVQRLVDDDLRKAREKIGPMADVRWMSAFGTRSWTQFRAYMNNLSDNFHQLDNHLVFSNMEVKKTDYVTRRLPYPLEPGECKAYNEIMETLYDPEERAKLEWATGAIIAGDARNIQKFVVLYGLSGTGKSTFLNIVQKLFAGYYVAFEAKALTSANNAFSTEVFKNNPLLAIQHDGDLSKIEDNTKLNSIISHEEIPINEKYKAQYMARINAFLFMGTNKPVKITDAKSGIIRRLIDVNPSGRLIPEARYHVLMGQTDFELGAIASHCLETYRNMGKDYYSRYRPIEMILQTDVFYNFIEQNYDVFRAQDSVTLLQAYEMYKNYCDESELEFKLPRHKFREELRNYFKHFHDRIMVDGVRVRSLYEGFLREKFTERVSEEKAYSLTLDDTESILDIELSDSPAQYSKWSEQTKSEIPVKYWSDVHTTLRDIDSHQLHYVKPPENHIVIDFDLRGPDGEKSAERNTEEAASWPSTYAEYSQSGSGIHLHYIYDGDVSTLSRSYSDGIEVKVFTGGASLRRRLSKCNNVPISRINTGLPLKEEKVINFGSVKSERSLREQIERNLRKEIHPGTKPSIDFIFKILEDAYKSELVYDVTNLRPRVLAFANNSTHQAEYCIKLVAKMRFQSELVSEGSPDSNYKSDDLVLFDVEVFPNLLLLSWKTVGSKKCVTLFNPTPQEIEQFIQYKLVGYNNRRYDNHIIYARYLGWTNEQIYNLSQKLVSNSANGPFAEAYNLSYMDIYDVLSIKKSLKAWQIELGIHHQELGYDWDKPVPEELWPKVAEYCENDVISEEVVMEHRKQDFVAREILSKLSGLSVNNTTQNHTARILFGKEKNPQKDFVYTDLSVMFPGYKYEKGVSTYKGEITGEGGLVRSKPGMYSNVGLLDIASMHPTSIEQLNAFGPYTKKYSDLKAARIAIKRKEYDAAEKMLGGVLKPYLGTDEDADALAYALKIVINIVYGLTSARFNNPFKDPRNIDNIVAKRGALFMIDLQRELEAQGIDVIHIKTDSIKIPNITPEIVQIVMDIGVLYGYEFELETVYEKFCLVNDAVYIAKTKPGPWNPKDEGHWTATGTQFAIPYVFKSLFSHEPILFDDMCVAKSVTTALYLDTSIEKPMFQVDGEKDKPQFIGKVGSFCPIKEGHGGGILLREKNGKYDAATGTKGYFWLESEVVKALKKEKDIDISYFTKQIDSAIAAIEKYGDPAWFLS